MAKENEVKYPFFWLRGETFECAKELNKGDIVGTYDEDLWFPPLDQIGSKLSYIDRVDIYLRDGRFLRNVFILGRHIAQYSFHNPYKSAVGPLSFGYEEKNIMKEFNFNSDDVILIKKNNIPRMPRKRTFLEKIFGINLLKKEEGIIENEVIKVLQWEMLPPPSEDDIIRKK